MTRATFAILGVAFEVGATDPVVGEHLTQLFGSFAPSSDEPKHRFNIVPVPGGWALDTDGEHDLESSAPEHLIGPTVHRVNRVVLDSIDALLIHAGVVECDGVEVLIPGAMNAGKSTLTAALCTAGCNYGSDEAVGFAWGSTIGVPFPKPLSLDHGSWSLFPQLEPHLDVATDGYKDSQWQIAPARFGGTIAHPRAPRLIVFREYRRGEPTVVQPVTRAAAIAGIARQTHRMRTHGARCLYQIDDITKGTRAVRISGGDIAGAVDAVLALVDEVRA